MDKKLNQILDLVRDYVSTKHKNKKWSPGEDWVSYSGPVYTSDEYVAAFESLLNEWLVFGEKGSEFENEFPKYLGKDHGILTNSGSSANLLMVSSLKSNKTHALKPGSKFITPVVCFPTTLNPLIQNGFTPVFVDVTLPDLNLNLDQVEEILQNDDDIRGIIFAHVLGNPPNMDRLMRLVEKYDLIFLEDACDALGSTYGGEKLGSFGDMSTCSFYPAHHMTMGEGGFVATNSIKDKITLSSFRDWGRACYCNVKKPGDVTEGTACGDRFKCWFKDRQDIVYDHRYIFNEIGYNLKPLELQAAMGLEQIKKLEDFDEKRKYNFARYLEIFKPYSEYFHLPRATEKSDPAWFAFLLTVKKDAPFTRTDFVSFLEKAKIQTRTYFAGNILFHPAYHDLKDNNIYPVAELVTTSSFFLGTFAGITDEKLDYIKFIVDDYFQELR